MEAPARALSAALPEDHGWVQARLSPGQYHWRLGGEHGSILRIPEGSGPIYLGDFVLGCGTPAGGCSPAATYDIPAATAVLALMEPAAPPLRIATATPNRMRAPAGSPVTVARIRLDQEQWRAALNRNVVPMPPDNRQGYWRNSGSLLRGTLSSPGAAFGIAVTAGLILVPLVPAMLITGGLVTGLEAGAQHISERVAEHEQQRLAACLDSVSQATDPVSVEQRLQAALAGPSGRPPRTVAGWDVAVTRVVLRRCGSQRFGVEVGSVWTLPARRGAASADIRFSRSVAGASPDDRLAFSSPPPWEVQLGPAAPCRALAEICGPGGAELLAQDLIDGVTRAQDAIASPHPETANSPH